MNEGLIPRRYAKSLYKYAQEHHCTQELYNDTQRIEKVFATHPALTKAMGNPSLSATEKEELLVMAAGSEAHKALLRFINLVILNRRESYFRACMLAYQDIYRQHNNTQRRYIRTYQGSAQTTTQQRVGVYIRDRPCSHWRICTARRIDATRCIHSKRAKEIAHKIIKQVII